MRTKLNVENMQCAHCVSTINTALVKINGVYGVEANIAEKTIDLDHTPDVNIDIVSKTLKDLGYDSTLTATDGFAHKAGDWDANPMRVAIADKFVRKVMELMPIPENAVLMDFGCGTGLVGLQFAPYVKGLVMVDNSAAMLDVLRAKLESLNLDIPVEICDSELSNVKAPSVNAIVSSMAFHHLENLEEVVAQMYEKLAPGGFLAIADLVKEDGSFHDEAVPHNGFEQTDICEIMSKVGFDLSVCEIYNKLKKKDKEYPQFLIIAKK